MQSDVVLKARMNSGRWIVDCPNCKGAEIARPGEKFICYSEYLDALRMPRAEAEARYPAYVVEFPENQTEIEAALARREHAAWRNWEWGMTIDELIAAEPFLHFSWTAPRTWVTGEVVTAAIGNTHWRDNLLETAPAKVTTAGDIVYATGANALTRLAIGTVRQVARVNDAGTGLEYGSINGVLHSQVFG